VSPEIVHLAAGAARWWLALLLANSLYAVVVAALAGLVVTLVPSTGPRLRHALWVLVLVRLALPPGLAQPFSLGALVPEIGRGAAVLLGDDGGSAGPAGVGSERWEPVAADGEKGAIAWPLLGLGVWLAGAWVAARRLRRGVRPYRNVVRRAVAASDPDLLGTLERWRRHLGVRRRVGLRLTGARATPFTVGVWRPLIVLPEAVLGRRALVEAAIAHEMAHVARLDPLWLGLERVLQVVYFFHPLVWWTGAAVDHERELICDRTVLDTGALPARAYAGGLLTALNLDLRGVEATTLTPHPRRTFMRIQTILSPRSSRDLSRRAAMVFSVVAGVVVLPLAGAAIDRQPVPAAVPGAVAAAAPVSPPELVNPLPGGRVTQAWGPGINPFTHEKYQHEGVDLAAPAGTSVVAAADGTVIEAQEEPGDDPRGRCVTVRHDQGLVTVYTHLEEVRVSEGDRVIQGQVIGTVGSTGLSTGPHLHFEVRSVGDATSLDPATLVDGL